MNQAQLQPACLNSQPILGKKISIKTPEPGGLSEPGVDINEEMMLSSGTVISRIALLGKNIMLYTVVGGGGPLAPVNLS